MNVPTSKFSIGLAVAACAVAAGVLAPSKEAAAQRWTSTISPAAAPAPVVAPPAPVAPAAPPRPQAASPAPATCGRTPVSRTIQVEIPAAPAAAPAPAPEVIVTPRPSSGRWTSTITYTPITQAPPPAPVGPTYRTEVITEWVDIPCPTGSGPQTTGLLAVGDPGTLGGVPTSLSTGLTAAVPEPGIFGLIGIGGLALWFAGRRRRD
ncbi:MAG TPA: PEP-CTERM sorting domain-containing protein [Burkholderiaceae bacterium]|jgi:hypothetical protein|nr:PEP-CTERM sorting domain-containing protein [Burkholderiaceae bacterium]